MFMGISRQYLSFTNPPTAMKAYDFFIIRMQISFEQLYLQLLNLNHF